MLRFRSTKLRLVCCIAVAHVFPYVSLAMATFSSSSSCGSSGSLSGKRVLITGGGRGIGRAIALNVASRGASVVVVSRTKDEIEAVVREAKHVAHNDAVMLALTADVTDEQSVNAAVKAAVVEMGGIDILINNAGRGSSKKGPLWEQDAADFQGLMDTNVLSVFLVSRAVLKESMLAIGSGDIINISSKAGKVGLAKIGPYVASKFAVEGLTACLAVELQDAGSGEIRVNSISPGMVDTRSFPKAPGRIGVRTAESCMLGIDLLLGSDVTGHYVHVDELDSALAAGKEPSAALKSINEPDFHP
jgi:3-oxoacyl-[acyl-carrier protein] reductase